ncbi:MAG: Ig-like domain-containing protein [Bacilli bacterium]
MKKNRIILLPLFMLLLAGCNPKPSSSVSDGTVSISSEIIDVPSEEEVVDVLTIAEARAASDGDKVQTSGKVTAIYKDSQTGDPNTYSVAIQDGELAILCYGVPEAVLGTEIKVGDNVSVTGSFKDYYGVKELESVTEVVLAEETFNAEALLIEDWTAIANWANMDSRLITIKGLSSPYNAELDPTKSNNYYLWQNQGLTEILVYINARTGAEAITAMKPVLDAADYLKESLALTGIVGIYKDNPQLLFYDANLAELTAHPEVDPTGFELNIFGGVAEVKQNLKLRLASIFTPAEVKSRAVTWSSSDTAIATVDEHGTVTGVIPGNVTITGTVTDEPSLTDSVEIEVLVMEAMEIADVRALETGKLVKVKGTVTSTSSSGNFTIQTGDAALYLYNVPGALRETFVVGHDVEVIGKTGEYEGLKQLANIEAVIDLGETLEPIEPTVVTDLATLVAGWDSRLVTIERLNYVSGAISTADNTASTIKATLGENQINLSLNKYTAYTDKKALKEIFDPLVPGDQINFTGVVGWYKNAQLDLHGAHNITIPPYEPGPVTAVAVTSPLDLYKIKVEDTLQLQATVTSTGPTKHEVTWASDATAVATVDENGVVTAVAVGEANITATSTVDETKSGTLKITVVAASTEVERVEYQTGFENAEGFTATTDYQNAGASFAPRLTGPAGKQWNTYFGTPSTTSPLTGTQSMQLRWYTSQEDKFGYTEMAFDVAKVTRVGFNYMTTGGLTVKVSFSTDGGTTWTEAETLAAAQNATYAYVVISETGEHAAVRIRFDLIVPTPAPTARNSPVYFDDVRVYNLG